MSGTSPQHRSRVRGRRTDRAIWEPDLHRCSAGVLNTSRRSQFQQLPLGGIKVAHREIQVELLRAVRVRPGRRFPAVDSSGAEPLRTVTGISGSITGRTSGRHPLSGAPVGGRRLRLAMVCSRDAAGR